MHNVTNQYEEVLREKKVLLVFLVVLCLVGIVMVLSASYQFSKGHAGDSLYFFSKQVMFFLLSVGLAFVCEKVKPSFWTKFSGPVHSFFIFVTMMSFMPGLGVVRNGARRWIDLGFISFQPAEFLKFSVIPFALIFFEEFSYRTPKENLKRLGILLFPTLLLALQPDFGTFAIYIILVGFVCFISSFPRKYFIGISLVSITTLALMAISQPYRIKRLLIFLDPWKDPTDSGFQITQSLMAVANGSFLGQGLGNSLGKLHYLPEAHNDFIFSIIGEEAGFIGVVITTLLFFAFMYHGFKLSRTLHNDYRSKIIAGIVFVISLQAFLNMGVVLSLLPTKGLNLPFISYGGSSLIANFFGIGILFSLCSRKEFFDRHADH